MNSIELEANDILKNSCKSSITTATISILHTDAENINYFDVHISCEH